MRNDQLISLQEHISDRHRFIQQSARIPAHVQNQPVQIAGVQLLQRVGNLVVGGLIKRGKPDVPDAGLQKEGDIDGVTWNFSTRDGEGQWIGITLAGDHNLDYGALGSLQHVCDFAGAQSIGGLVVYLDNHIARPQTCVVCRRANVRRHYYRVVVPRRDDHAHAVILAALIFTEQGKLAGVKKVRVGIENAQHAGDCALVDLFVHVHRFSIVGLHDVEDRGEFAHGGLAVLGLAGGGSYRRPVNPAKHGRCDQYCENNDESAAILVHSDLTRPAALSLQNRVPEFGRINPEIGSVYHGPSKRLV